MQNTNYLKNSLGIFQSPLMGHFFFMSAVQALNVLIPLYGRIPSIYCRFLLSFFYFSRSFQPGKTYYRAVASKMWYV